MKTLYLIRHGAVNYETKEYSLSENGRDEMRKLGKNFKEERFPVPELVISSDRPRTLQSAQLFCNELGFKLNLKKVTRDPQRDIEFPMRLFEELNTQNNTLDLVIDNTVQECNPPKEFEIQGPVTNSIWEGQETDIKNIISLIETTMENSDTVAIFTHANIIALCLQDMFKDTLDLKSFGTGCETSSLTVMTKIVKWKISRLFSLEHTKQ